MKKWVEMLILHVLLASLAYAAVTSVLFGGPFQPIGLATFWSDRLGVPYWRSIALIGVAISAIIFALPLKHVFAKAAVLPTFVILAVLLPTLMVGLYADAIRHGAALALGAEEIEEHSFFRSIREAPADFQFFLHTAALKGCTPYAWSYRSLTFYVVPPAARANVLPRPWINRCGF